MEFRRLQQKACKSEWAVSTHFLKLSHNLFISNLKLFFLFLY